MAALEWSREAYAQTGEAAGVATNASWVGPWIPVLSSGAIGFQVVMAGTGSPTGTWGADITDDAFPGKGTLGATALTLTSAMTALNPSGNGQAINALFMFDPTPPAKWMRFKLTIASGGTASPVLFVGAASHKRGGG